MSTAQPRPRLVADIGGTNARFALVDAAERIYAEQVLSCADHHSITAAISAYLEQCPEPKPTVAALAVATPVTGDQVTFTNNADWSFSIDATRQALGFEQLRLLNDFTALALALPHLDAQERVQIGGDAPIAETVMGLIGPGTGLGVSGLVWSGSRWVPLQTEGGHVSFAPATEKEWAIAQVLQQHYGHVSMERLVSGPGLVNINQALRELAGQPPESLEPADITERGLTDSCPYCKETLEIFCAMLGAAAGNLALTLGARSGVYIGGGIAPRLGDFLARSAFRDRFEAKGRLKPYLTPIPVWVITAVHPALRGVAAAVSATE
ncbi:MAG: glucokinase [Candidatus Competibacteraceae bacterium]|nr:glucokinase [Candidatus Competibacteraceae bacterium]